MEVLTMNNDYKVAEKFANEYREIFNEIERIIDFSDDYDDDLIDHMERCAVDLEDDLTTEQKAIYYELINDLQSY